MNTLTLQQLFGVNASQDAQSLIIQKADLTGLTPSLDNRGEQLLIAVLLKALESFQGYIEDENGIPITDENYSPIEFDNKNAYDGLSLFSWNPFREKRGGNLYVKNTVVLEHFVAYEIE